MPEGSGVVQLKSTVAWAELSGDSRTIHLVGYSEPSKVSLTSSVEF